MPDAEGSSFARRISVAVDDHCLAPNAQRPTAAFVRSDRGRQHRLHIYRKILRAHRVKAAISGNGDSYEKAAVLRRGNSPLTCFLILLTWFKTIVAEVIWLWSCKTRRQPDTCAGIRSE